MTDKQKRFCDEYLIDCNGKQAAIRAGYSEKTAYSIAAENLKKPEVKQYLEQQMQQLHSAKVADAQEVMAYLTAVMRGEQTEEVPLLCGEGCQQLAEKTVGAKERLKAAELIGKRYGMFTDKMDLEGVAAVRIVGADALED